MLNRYKIGVKLFAGFIVVLALLGVVGVTGWYAITQVLTMMAEVEKASDLSQQGLLMQQKIKDALIAMNKEALTKEEKYANEVKNIVADIKTTFAGLDDKMQRQESKDAFIETMNKVSEFGDSEIKYWNNAVKQKELTQKRLHDASATVDSVEKLASQIMEVTQGNPKYAITRPNDNGAEQVFYDAVRVKLVNDIGSVSGCVLQIRIACYQYDTAATEAKKTEARETIKQGYEDINKRLADIAPSIQTDAGQALLDTLRENRDAWEKTVQETMTLTDALAGIEANSEKITDEMVTQIKTMLGMFNSRAEEANKEAKGTGSRMKGVLTVACGLAVVFGLFISYVLTVNITRGIGRASGAMKMVADEGFVAFEVSQGDMSRGDEVGTLAHAFDGMLRQFQNVERMATELAEGNYNIETKVRSDKDTMNINLNKMLDQVNQALGEIDESVKQVATGSGEVSSAAQSLSNGAQESAASLEEITASMSEISSQTKSNAEGAAQARNLAQKASKAAGEGQEAMKDMTTAMERITQNSNEIQRVIKVIDDIAFQTNLLALNAAVEAARAGQHGKGFAVVAEEVRNLASRSAKAARETSDLIAKSGQEIEKGGEVATHTAEVLNTIVDQIKQTTELVAGIAVASNEQAHGVEQITVGLQQIDAVTQQNTAAAEQSASAANEMSSMAANLQRLVARFRLRGQSGNRTATASYTPPKPAPMVKMPVGPKVGSAIPKPAQQRVADDPSMPVSDNNWGGGGSADIHIDLDSKDFGKY